MSQAKDGSSSPSKQLPISKQKIPPPRLQLQLEIEAYNRIIKRLEKEKKSAGDEAQISINWNEVATRKILYDTLVGAAYTTPAELSRLQKMALVKTFTALHGHAWSRKNGWVGQPKILKKPEVLLFEAESSLFEGIEVIDVGLGQKTSFVVSTVRLEGIGVNLFVLYRIQSFIFIITSTVPQVMDAEGPFLTNFVISDRFRTYISMITLFQALFLENLIN